MKARVLVLAAACAALLGGCAPLPQQPGMNWVPSPNYNERRPNYVILHHTSNDTLDEALRTLTTPARMVSAHYLIGRDGSVVQIVDENARAWHAGESWWGGLTDLNSASIGIELDNNGREPFPDTQIDVLIALLADIRARHGIPAANFIGHADVAPGRKIDPSAFFPWRRLAGHGFGLWCDEPPDTAPQHLDLALLLAALGYDSARLAAARQAFLLHHFPGNPDPSPEAERAMAFCLWLQKTYQAD